VLAATLLALGAAVLHAGWNLAVKQASGDRFIALWGQFSIAGVLSAVGLLIVGGIPAAGYQWAAVTGLIHIPYCTFLARAYDRGEFSLVYPVARGGGAVLGAVGGIVLLHDHLSPLGVVAIAVVGGGLGLLAGSSAWAQLVEAVVVALTIGVYSVADARGVRVSRTSAYAFATFAVMAVTLTSFGVATGRRVAMRTAMAANWRRFTVIGIVSGATYAMVIAAFRWAPVGYVTALRESSVLLAAVIGWRHLGERAGLRRTVAAGAVMAGLALLVAAR
jgi:drug/metabolite transporter (DMT)-like permease